MGKASTVKVTVKNAGLTAKRLKQVFEAGVMPVLAEQILSDCNEYVRVDQGTLRDSAHTESGGRKIVWSTKYAKRVYYTGTPSKLSNPNASLRWCEKAKRTYAKEWGEQATKLLKG